MKRLALALCFAASLSAAARTDLAGASALYTQGRYADASAAFEQIARTEPESAVVLFHLGKLAVHGHDYAAAIERLTRAAALAPNDAAITLWLGNAHAWSASVSEGLTARVSHGRKALALYRRAVALDPENVPARFALMNFYRHVPAMLGGGLDRAYREAGEIARRDATAGAYARALLSFHEQKFSVAYDTLELLLEKSPDHYGANFLLGRLAAASRQHCAEGRASLQRCLRLTPTENDDPHADARALLAQLEAPEVAAKK
ncbi:MAG: tetratricopeptide repeat protein [Opitutae bacterium]|nr:tetratricopeptide repeat protein [Opitutae bacterium]